MKKILNLMALIFTSAMLSFAFTSCSDNDENEEQAGNGNNSGSTTTISSNLAELFPYGRPKQMGTSYNLYDLSYDSNGLLTTVKEEYKTISFNYAPGDGYDVKMTVTYANQSSDICYFKLNEAGVAYYAKTVYDDGDTFIVNFTYNADGQISAVDYKTSDQTTGRYDITYANGDIVKIELTDIEDGISETDTFNYTYTDIVNKGAFILFDSIYDIDIEEIEYAYFAGILGKAPRHLVDAEYYNYADGYNGIQNFTWTLNGQGLPTMLNDGYEDYKIVW